MKHDKQWHHFRPLSCLFFMFLLPSICLGAQDITANWAHRESKDNQTEDTYTVTYSLELQQEISETMSLQESFRYSSGWHEDYDNQNIDPSLRFTINNDLFLLELNGSASKQNYSDSENQTKTNAEAIWASNWDRRFWPNLRTSYGTNWQEDDASIKVTDSKTINETFALDWDLEIFKVYYNYNRNLFSNFAENGENNTTNNFGRLEADHHFLQNRFNFGFSHQYSETRDVTITNVGLSGLSLVRQTLSQVLHGLDSTPLITAGELTPVTALHDGDLVTASSVATDGLDNPPHNIAMKVDFKSIDMIYLYTTVDQAANSGGFSFALYTSDNGVNWQLNTANLPFSYNNSDNRFEMPVASLNNLWLKIVITASPLTTIDISEIETYRIIIGTGEVQLTSVASSSITDLNLGFILTNTLSLSYNLSIEDGEYGSGVDYDRYNQTGNLTWQPQANFTSTLGLNESTKQNGDADKSKSRSYTLNMDTIPLDTLAVNMGLSRAEEYVGATRQSVDYNVGVLTTAALYPDLDASLDCNYGHITQDNTNISTEDYYTTLIITARLVPSLTADLTTGYQEILGSDGNTSTDTTLNLNWRTSEMLSIHMAARKEWDDNNDDSEGASLSLSLAPTDTTQFSLNYIYTNTTERINKYSCFGSWSLGPHFTLQGNGNYSESPSDVEWQVQTQLVARFSIL